MTDEQLKELARIVLVNDELLNSWIEPGLGSADSPHADRLRSMIGQLDASSRALDTEREEIWTAFGLE
jgi:hypothetical protein